MAEDGPQHSGGMTGSLKAARAAVVLVVFVVAVGVLVAVGTRSTPSNSTSAQTTTTTAAASGSTTTTTARAAGAAGAASSTTTTVARHGHGHGAATTTTTVPHASVSVVVANATNTAGLAAHYTTVIGAGGWKMGTPIDASTSEATSTVYYASGQQAAAATIAAAVGVKSAQVQPLTTSTPVNGVTGTDVVVVVANATNTAGLAAHYTTVIGAGGWKMGTPIDASTSEATSTVYYASGQQGAAATIAAAVGVKSSQVQPLTTSTPVNGVTGTDVVVVVGQDLAAASAGS